MTKFRSGRRVCIPLTQALSASRPRISSGPVPVIGAACATKSSAMILSVTPRSPFHRSFQGPASAALAELVMTVPSGECEQRSISFVIGSNKSMDLLRCPCQIRWEDAVPATPEPEPATLTPEPVPMRERYRAQVRREVKQAALHQLAESGPAGVSVSAIGKQPGVSGPALYRYFASRDELLTELVIDAYDDMADALRAAA